MELYHSNLGTCFHKEKVLDSCTKFVLNEKNPSSELNLNKGIQISDRSPRFKSCSLYPSAIVSLKETIEKELKYGKLQLDPNMDMKKLRRTLSNRLSTQRFRGKKAQYILDMEKKVELLQDMITVLTPLVQSQKEKQKFLLVEKDSLLQEVDKVFNKEKLHEKDYHFIEMESNNNYSNLDASLNKGKGVQISDEPPRSMSSSPNPSAIFSFNKDKLVLDSFARVNRNKGIHISDQPSQPMSCSLYPSDIGTFKESNEINLGKRKLDANMDGTKKLTRYSDKLSTQISIEEKNQYILYMENQARLLKDTITILTSRLKNEQEKLQSTLLEIDTLQQEGARLFEKAMQYHREIENRKDGNNGMHVPDSSSKANVQTYPNLKFFKFRTQNPQKLVNQNKPSEFDQHGRGDQQMFGNGDQLSSYGIKECDNMFQDEEDTDVLLDLHDIMVNLYDDGNYNFV